VLKCEFFKLNGWIHGRWIWDEFSSHVFKPFSVWNSCVLSYKISICQWDEKQGMILIQDEGNHFNIWIFIKFFNNLWDNISCLKGVDHRVCFPAWDKICLIQIQPLVTSVTYHVMALSNGHRKGCQMGVKTKTFNRKGIHNVALARSSSILISSTLCPWYFFPAHAACCPLRPFW